MLPVRRYCPSDRAGLNDTHGMSTLARTELVIAELGKTPIRLVAASLGAYLATLSTGRGQVCQRQVGIKFWLWVRENLACSADKV